MRRIAIVMIIAGAAASLGADSTQPYPSGEWCWQPVAPDTGPEDVNTLSTGPAMAANASGDLWLIPKSRILKRSGRQWTNVAAVSRAGVDGPWPFIVVTSPSGRAVIGAAANRDDGSADLHIGRETRAGWEWLGPPLISSGVPFTHVITATIAFAGEQPIVAWTEEIHAEMGGVFVSQWDGSSWRRLGTIDPRGDDYYLPLALAVDRTRRIWIAWEDAQGMPWVARWNGTAWVDVGRDMLTALASTSGRISGRQLALTVDASGHAWLLWVAPLQRGGGSMMLARWDGNSWTLVPTPRGPAGKDSTVWSVAMLLRGNAPIIAWSQSDDSDNHRLFASEWVRGDRWTPRLSAMHLAEGVSNVDNVSLSTGRNRNVYFAWDEPGKDKRRTRLIESYPCAAGETPLAPPPSAIERETWPATVDEAARRLIAELDDASRARVRATAKDQLILYLHGWGTGIRNTFGLWRGNDALLLSCGAGKRADPEACSMGIIEAVWALLQSPK